MHDVGTDCCTRWRQVPTYSFDAIAVLDARAEKCFGWLPHDIYGEPLACRVLSKAKAAAFSREFEALQSDPGVDPARQILLGMTATRCTGHTIPIEISLTRGGTAQQQEIVDFIPNMSDRQSPAHCVGSTPGTGRNEPGERHGGHGARAGLQRLPALPHMPPHAC